MRKTYQLFLILLLLGCGDESEVLIHPSGPGRITNPKDSNVVGVAEGDLGMLGAMQQARSSFPGFLAQMPLLRTKGDYYSVKVPILAGGDTEHVWLTGPEYQDGRISGAIGNDPTAGPHKLGDVVDVAEEEISDWMAVVDGELFGGFTIFELRRHLPPDQQGEMAQSLGFRVPPTPREF